MGLFSNIGSTVTGLFSTATNALTGTVSAITGMVTNTTTGTMNSSGLTSLMQNPQLGDIVGSVTSAYTGVPQFGGGSTPTKTGLWDDTTINTDTESNKNLIMGAIAGFIVLVLAVVFMMKSKK